MIRIAYLISALGSQLAEPVGYLLIVTAGKMIKESFKVAGNEYIH